MAISRAMPSTKSFARVYRVAVLLFVVVVVCPFLRLLSVVLQIWKVNHPSEAMAWGDDGMDEDDIVVGAQVESFICPLTQKPFERPMKK